MIFLGYLMNFRKYIKVYIVNNEKLMRLFSKF